MKKITLLFILCVGFTFNSHAQLPETFDTEIPATWAVFSGLNEEGPTYTWQHSNGYVLCQWESATAGTTAEDWLVSPLTPITTTTSLLTFDQTDYYALDYGSSYTVRISTTSQTDITSFTTVDTQAEPSVTNGAELVFSGYSVDLSAYEGVSVYIAFVLEQNNGDAWFLDNIDLENQNATAPNPATTPNPADGATVTLTYDVDYNNDGTIDETDYAYTFTWSQNDTGDAPSSYSFKFGTTSEMTGLDTSTTNNDGFSIYGLLENTTYYWQIVPVNAGGSAVEADCPVWSFTTSSSLSVEDDLFSALVVGPNPVKDILNINSPVAIDDIKVFNQLGQNVLDVNGSIITNNQVDLSPLNSGIYIVKITSKEKSKTIKVIKE